jgi:hypothetical protein
MHRPVIQRIRKIVGAAAVFAAALVITFALAGCGSSVDDALVKETGVHGNQLEKVYNLYNQNVLQKVSSRDLKGINAALKAGNLKQATPGDVRRAENEIHSRIQRLDKFVSDLKAANRKLKNTPEPNFSSGLDKNFANDEFAKAYSDVTKNVERYTTSDLAAVTVAFSSLEKYLNFLSRWEVFLTKNDTSGLVAAGNASDAAVAKMNQTSARLDRRGTLNSKIKPLVDRMASAASNSSQLTTLIDEMRKQYPKSFLAVHVIEKKK